jgi:hypothetical protein
MRLRGRVAEGKERPGDLFCLLRRLLRLHREENGGELGGRPIAIFLACESRNEVMVASFPRGQFWDVKIDLFRDLYKVSLSGMMCRGEGDYVREASQRCMGFW